jgi:hypothetical protein
MGADAEAFDKPGGRVTIVRDELTSHAEYHMPSTTYHIVQQFRPRPHPELNNVIRGVRRAKIGTWSEDHRM